MLRIHGDRQSLLAALTCHWLHQQLGLEAAPSEPQRQQSEQFKGTGTGRMARL